MRDWCCLHALNNAVGAAAFTHLDFESVRGKRGCWGDGELEVVLLNHASFQGVSFARADPRRRALFDLFLTFDTFLGYVVKCDNAHWVALRRDASSSSSSASFELVDSIGCDVQRLMQTETWTYLDGLRGNHHAIFRRGGIDVARLLSEDARRRRRAVVDDQSRGSERLRRVVDLANGGDAE